MSSEEVIRQVRITAVSSEFKNRGVKAYSHGVIALAEIAVDALEEEFVDPLHSKISDKNFDDLSKVINILSLHDHPAYDRENRQYVCSSCYEFICDRVSGDPFELIHAHQAIKLAEAGLLNLREIPDDAYQNERDELTELLTRLRGGSGLANQPQRDADAILASDWLAKVKARAVAELLPLIRDMHDPDPCRFDRHGGCQEHGYLNLQPDEICPQKEAQDLLKNAGLTDE